jgi:hypothetical protein
MRLVIAGLVLFVTILDYRFGDPGTVLHVAGLVDHFFPEPGMFPVAPDDGAGSVQRPAD